MSTIREALVPFARYADELGEGVPDEHIRLMSMSGRKVTAGDLRRARAALLELDALESEIARLRAAAPPASEWRPRAPEPWEVEAHNFDLWAYRNGDGLNYPTWHTLAVGAGGAIVIDGMAFLSAWQRGHPGTYLWRPYDSDGNAVAWPAKDGGA